MCTVTQTEPLVLYHMSIRFLPNLRLDHSLVTVIELQVSKTVQM